jgi:hypothetical protein
MCVPVASRWKAVSLSPYTTSLNPNLRQPFLFFLRSREGRVHADSAGICSTRALAQSSTCQQSLSKECHWGLMMTTCLLVLRWIHSTFACSPSSLSSADRTETVIGSVTLTLARDAGPGTRGAARARPPATEHAPTGGLIGRPTVTAARGRCQPRDEARRSAAGSVDKPDRISLVLAHHPHSRDTSREIGFVWQAAPSRRARTSSRSSSGTSIRESSVHSSASSAMLCSGVSFRPS